MRSRPLGSTVVAIFGSKWLSRGKRCVITGRLLDSHNRYPTAHRGSKIEQVVFVVLILLGIVSGISSTASSWWGWLLNGAGNTTIQKSATKLDSQQSEYVIFLRTLTGTTLELVRASTRGWKSTRDYLTHSLTFGTMSALILIQTHP